MAVVGHMYPSNAGRRVFTQDAELMGRIELHLLVAIDRTSKFAFVELHEKATTGVAVGRVIAWEDLAPSIA